MRDLLDSYILRDFSVSRCRVYYVSVSWILFLCRSTVQCKVVNIITGYSKCRFVSLLHRSGYSKLLFAYGFL